MTAFIHDDPEFADLARIVGANHGLAPGLIEKDYWVTHTLWALQDIGLEVWFKGGTSLSKGFGLITRFSEDLDLRIEAGRVAGVPAVANWRSDGKVAIAGRATFFRALAGALTVPGADVALVPSHDGRWRDAELRVTYEGQHLGDLAGVLRPYVLLEVGNARVTPFVPRTLSSFIHDHLVAEGLAGEYADNRPKDVRCVHPLVTLIEKLDALAKRVSRAEVEPAAFVRHFEDAARIILAEERLPALDGYADVQALTAEMASEGQIKDVLHVDREALSAADPVREAAIRAAYTAIGRMFWGDRLDIDDARATIAAWVHSTY